jgi:hypothetical protein
MTGFTASLLKILTIWPVSFVWRAALDNRIPLRKICVDSACRDIGQDIGQEDCQEEVCQEEGVRCQEKKVSGRCQEGVRKLPESLPLEVCLSPRPTNGQNSKQQYTQQWWWSTVPK